MLRKEMSERKQTGALGSQDGSQQKNMLFFPSTLLVLETPTTVQGGGAGGGLYNQVM